MTAHRDVVIIGGGHNGLTAAAYLAQAGEFRGAELEFDGSHGVGMALGPSRPCMADANLIASIRDDMG